MTTTPPVVESMLSAKDELIAEAAAAIPPSVWMDISTAPKDGTLVQLWGKYWSDGQGMMKEPLVGNWMRERWEVWGPGGRFGIRPTHWTNLPTKGPNTMSDETAKPGAPPTLTGAQELLVLAQRLDGFMEWLGGPNHTGWHHIQDMPDKLRDLARKQLLAKPEGLPFPKDAYEAEFMQKAGYAWIAQNKPERLTQLARDNRDAVLEQAGLVADGWALSNFDESANVMAHNIGNDIRALKSHQTQNPASPLAFGSGTANTPVNENASPEPPEGVLDMRGMLRRTPVPDFEPDLDTEALFQAGRPIL